MISKIARLFSSALVSLWRAPGFTATCVGTLALAIGASAAIFALVDGVLIEPLPFPDADRLVVVQGSASGTDLGDEFNLAPEFLIEYDRDADLLESIASFGMFTSTFRTDERADRLMMSSPSSSFFGILGVEPQIGRLPVLEDAQEVVLLSDQLWTDWFGRDPTVIGQSFFTAGQMRTVIGVMPPEFEFPRDDVMLWFPNSIVLAVDLGMVEITPGNFTSPMIARMRPGVEIDELAAQLTTIARRLPEQYGGSATYREIIERFSPLITPFRENLKEQAQPLLLLLGATAILLIIACANVANLFLARAARQRHDIAIRRSLGAPRFNLIVRQLAETVIVGALAGAVALVIATMIVPIVVNRFPIPLPRLQSVAISEKTILYTVAVSLVAGVVCGIVPAFRNKFASLAWVRDVSRTATRAGNRGRAGLVVAQAALALLLLVGSGLLIRSYFALANVDAGYDTEDIFTFQMAPERPDLADDRAWASFHLDVMQRLRGLPGVETVGIVENFPLNEGTQATGFSVVPAETSSSQIEHRLQVTFTAGDYFEAMGIDVLGGRPFTDGEQTDNPGSAIVSRSTAERLWPGEDPIGKTLIIDMFGFEETVVGVVEDVRQYDFRDETGPDVYLPLVAQSRAWTLTTPAYVLRSERADSIGADVRALIREIAPEAPFYRVFTIEQLVDQTMATLSFTTMTLGLASGLSLFLGMLGLYGILSFAVVERTRELGIRIALGADPQGVRRMVVKQGLKYVVLGVVLGLVVAIFTSNVLESLLFGIGSLDIATLAATSFLMLAVGALASWLPAYRASNVDPVETLAES